MKRLKELLLESSSKDKNIIKDSYEDDVNYILSAFNWICEIGWDKDEEDYRYEVPNINSDMTDDDMDYYAPIMVAMANLGERETKKYLKSILSDEDIELFNDYGSKL